MSLRRCLNPSETPAFLRDVLLGRNDARKVVSISVIGAGPLGLQSAIEAAQRGHNVQVASDVVPDSLELTKLVTAGNAAGYGGPFGGKDPLIRGFVEQSWPRWMELARDT